MKNETKEYKIIAKEFFNKHKQVACPAFSNEIVVFNSKGMSHLFYKGANKKHSRSIKEVKVRVGLLDRAFKVLQSASFFQEEDELENIDGKVVRYIAFEAVVDDRRIKVIVRQIGNGKKHFWSVIPAWRKVRGKRVNAKGDLSKQ